jgi:hypothetical protein
VRPPDEERPYTLDDLVSHEKRQMRLIALVLLVAMVVLVGRRVTSDRAPAPDEEGAPAPVGSRR